jgi:rubredoxin
VEESRHEFVCPKCGGDMKDGQMKINLEMDRSQTMENLVPNLDMSASTRAGFTETLSIAPHWEEKTGRKTGFIFKKEEVKEIRIRGHRCTLCNYIELYADE